MKPETKQYFKFLLQKKYREQIRQREKEGRIEVLSKATGNTNLKMEILQRRNREVGVFSDYIVFLRMIENAVERNCIPVIDRLTIKNIFFPAEDDVNTWECFFEQPLGYSMNDIDYSSMEVSINHIASAVSPVSIIHCKDESVIAYWRDVARRYIRFKPEISNHLERQRMELIDGKRVLGVSIREGYIKLSEKEPEKLCGHPVQAGITEMVDLTAEYMKKWNCQYVFFTCQTSDTEYIFKQKFGDKAISYKRERPSYEKLPEGKELIKAKSVENAYDNELGYVTEIYLLSNCTSFLCSENSGSEAAFIMSKGFENFFCIEKGTYLNTH